MLVTLILEGGNRHLCLEEIGPFEFLKVEKIDLFNFTAHKVINHNKEGKNELVNFLKGILEIGDRRYFIGLSKGEIDTFLEKESPVTYTKKKTALSIV